MIVLRETASTVRPSVDLRGLSSSSSHRPSGGPTRLFGAADGTNVRPFPTCVSQAGRRGPEPGAWQAPHTPRQDFARCQRRPRRISQLLPLWPGPAASRWLGGTRPPRASNKDLGSRRLETLSGRSDIMGARKMISSSLRRFWSAPRESAFPPLRQEGGTARERGRAARRRELRQWRRWGNRRWPGGRRAEHGRSGRATSPL